MLFSTLIYCSESVALSQFLHGLISTQSPRTIIQATVNTVQSESVRESAKKRKISQFYMALHKIFHFQLGKIRLASASPSELKAMLAKDWPYFTHYSNDIDQCLKGSSCKGVTDLVQTLGNLSNYNLNDMLSFLGLLGSANEVSFHPGQLTDSSGSLTPAALIPFCAYQTKITLLGQKKKETNLTSCSQFQQTLLNDQICYSFNLSSIDTMKSEVGKRAGLVDLIGSGQPSKKKPLLQTTDSDTLDLESSIVDHASDTIHLNTLSLFTDYRAGSYALTDLKKMTGTHSFLNQTDKANKCMTQTAEDCQAVRYIEAVNEKCGCFPWTLSTALEVKVMAAVKLKCSEPKFQDAKVCSPETYDCYTSVSIDSNDCMVPCTGLYADIAFTPDNILIRKQPNSGKTRMNILKT